MNSQEKFNIEWDDGLFGSPAQPTEQTAPQQGHGMTAEGFVDAGQTKAPYTDGEPMTASELHAKHGRPASRTHDEALAAFHRHYGTQPTDGGPVPPVFSTLSQPGSGEASRQTPHGGMGTVDRLIAQLVQINQPAGLAFAGGGDQRALEQLHYAGPNTPRVSPTDQTPAQSESPDGSAAVSSTTEAVATDEAQPAGVRAHLSLPFSMKLEGLRGKRITREKVAALGLIAAIGWAGWYTNGSADHQTLDSTAIACQAGNITVPFSEQVDVQVPFKLSDAAPAYMHAKANYTSKADVNLCGIKKKAEGKSEAMPLLTYADGKYTINRSAVTYTAKLAIQKCSANLVKDPTKPQFCITKPDGAFKVDPSTHQTVKLPNSAKPAAGEAPRLANLISSKGKNFKQYQTLIADKMYYAAMQGVADTALKQQVQKALKDKLGPVAFSGKYAPNDNDGSATMYAKQHGANLSSKTVQTVVSNMKINGVAQSLKGAS
ncbi:MAG TPA: hypothetical protein VFL85_01100 [Candidatus Saccharimonadales bacterium]|nr:hypothetical protein [Candidatus Saccharimonadales bacterium]